MQRFSSDYVVMQIVKHFNYAVVSVHQQVGSGENVEHLKAGVLEPDIGKLGDNRLISRDYKIVLGLFNPHKHKIPKHNGYDITKLGPYYRSLHIIKHRGGPSNIDIGLFFDGNSNYFKDLPHPTDTKQMEIVYQYINQIENL